MNPSVTYDAVVFLPRDPNDFGCDREKIIWERTGQCYAPDAAESSQFTEQLGCEACFCQPRCVPKRRKRRGGTGESRERKEQKRSREKKRDGERWKARVPMR